MVLLIVEILLPGAFMIWLGIGAIAVGAIDSLATLCNVKLSLGTQGILFALLSIIATVMGRKFYKGHVEPGAVSTLNRRGEQYMGRTITLSAPIVDNRGHTRIDDTSWTVRGQNCPAGTVVIVTAVDGAILVVEAVKSL